MMTMKGRDYTSDGLPVVSLNAIDNIVDRIEPLRIGDPMYLKYTENQINRATIKNKELVERNTNFFNNIYYSVGLNSLDVLNLDNICFLIPFELLGGFKDDFPFIPRKTIDTVIKELTLIDTPALESQIYDHWQQANLVILQNMIRIEKENPKVIQFCNYLLHNACIDMGLYNTGLSQFIFNYESIRRQFQHERIGNN